MTVRKAYAQGNCFDLLTGIIALSTACILIRFFNLETIIQFVRWFKQKCDRTIDQKEAWIIWCTVHRAKKVLWTRIACLESSLAFILLALSKKLSADWCIGVKLAPFESHAWIEVNGSPFQEPNNIQCFTKIFTV